MAKKYSTRRKKSKNNIRFKMKKLKTRKLKTGKYKKKRMQYGCKKMKGGNAMLDITGNIGGSVYNSFSHLNNTLGGHTNNSFTSVADYPKV